MIPISSVLPYYRKLRFIIALKNPPHSPPKMEEETNCTLWLLQFFVLSGLLILFIWLGIRPKSPSYTITSFSVENGSIPFALDIQNPNKDSKIYYNNINFTCYHNQDILGSVLIPQFSQDKEETTPEISKIIMNDKAWKALQNEIANRSAELQVTLVTQIRYRTWGIKSPRLKQRLKSRLPIGPDGKIPGKTTLNSSKRRIKRT